jgi:nitroimidazol reductase NimA-like FMN-containing flavoprotein (pyridoxamine 5'-phosphate oxidase superfamily)
MTTSPGALTVLSDDECWALLEGQWPRLGRIGFRHGDATAIYPMNYAIADRVVFLRTEPTSDLTAAVDTQGVAFEVDDVDHDWERGWSVLVQGRLHRVVDLDELEQHRELRLRAWVQGERLYLLRLVASHISGRRLG